jgi:hypothetical protein
MLLVHYGAWKFDLKKFEKIENTIWCKPKGGLWTSPINSKYSWKRFCKSEHFRSNSLKSRMILKLDDSTNILKIDSLKDALKMKWLIHKFNNKFEMQFPNFELLKTKYDAIYLTRNGERETRLSRPHSLYGWDVETVFIMNPLKIKQISPIRYATKD